VTDRLRTPPTERFAGARHLFSLSEALEELRAEDHPARDGHRQVTLFHRGSVTQVLFSFEPGGRLEEHSTPGLVTIHALEGRVEIEAEGVLHSLPAGSVLILDPNVPHDVRAIELSAMLLTVHLQKSDG
jgi:quercetin dioxygenase-like cupin family protein